MIADANYIGMKVFGRKRNLLMFDPVTGKSGGKRKSTVVMITYAIPICRVALAYLLLIPVIATL